MEETQLQYRNLTPFPSLYRGTNTLTSLPPISCQCLPLVGPAKTQLTWESGTEGLWGQPPPLCNTERGRGKARWDVRANRPRSSTPPICPVRTTQYEEVEVHPRKLVLLPEGGSMLDSICQLSKYEVGCFVRQ